MTKTIKLEKFLITVGFALLAFALASVAMAATYQYVDVNGNLLTIVADNPTEAINNAPNRAPSSGVVLVSSASLSSGTVLGVSTLTATVTSGTELYAYVDVSGNVRTVVASSAAEALVIAPNRAPNSGVVLVGQASVSSGSVLGATTVVSSGANLYMYVDISGNVRTVMANSAAEAFAKAVNIAPNSGVALVNA
ncbi:MAG: hypothetical protein Q8Q32_00760 [bacterium]|nr:hypothetical protein [bacterium]